MLSVPFRLKVPGKDEVSGVHIASTTFSFHGRLRLDPPVLHIEWSGTAAIDDVSGFGVRSETIALPSETLSVPLDCLYAAKLQGGWWRPRLILIANELTGLAIVPSEEGGRVSFWLARADRRAAAQLLAAIQGTQRRLGSASGSSPPETLPTPPGDAD
jgi:hypothetical protein